MYDTVLRGELTRRERRNFVGQHPSSSLSRETAATDPGRPFEQGFHVR